MKNYFKRLKQHPGLEFATMLTILMFAAAGMNKNVNSIYEWLFLSGIGISIIWISILISNIKTTK